MLQQQLESGGIVTRMLHASHAFHSGMMNPVIEPFLAQCKGVALSAPKIPLSQR